MAVLTHNGAQRKPLSLLPVITAVVGVVRSVAKKIVAPHKASLANLRAVPLTVAGAGCIDYAAWHLNSGLGWLAIGASLLVLELIIADEE